MGLVGGMCSEWEMAFSGVAWMECSPCIPSRSGLAWNTCHR